MNTTDVGSHGEQLVAEELTRLGYEVLERNWKTKWAEIDIVARHQGIMYFIEVKYRATENQGDGFDYITSKKLQHMTRASELWVNIHNWTGEYQLLGVSVTGSSNKIDIREIT